MLNLKRMVCMLLTAGMFTTALPVQALAASDYQYITNISLKVEVDLDAGDEVNSGDSVGTSKDDSGTCSILSSLLPEQHTHKYNIHKTHALICQIHFNIHSLLPNNNRKYREINF